MVNFGTFTVYGKTMLPQSASIVDGRLKVNPVAVGDLILEFLKASFTGTTPNADPTQLHYVTTLDAPVLGIMPFSITKTYSPNEFWSMISDQSGNYSC